MGVAARTILAPHRPHKSFRLLRAFFYLAAFALGTLSILVMLNNTWPMKSGSHRVNTLDKISAALGVQEKVYAVVIDAGSTGSRVLAFTFFRSLTDNSLKLEDELWHEVKPGLSFYKDDPVKGAESLLPLLAKAKERIPKDRWPMTPLILKATAGLRLLPTEKADDLLKEVKKLLNNSEFYTTDKSVEIMDGREEGIFSWFTVNYLLDVISGSVDKTLVALDLGGGSTQITFIPTESETLNSVPSDFLSSITLFHKDLKLFTHSYLGLGLMAGRAAVLNSHRDEEGVVRSPCINPIIETTWEYNSQSFDIHGPVNPKYREISGKSGRIGEKRPIADYEHCYRTCLNVIKSQVANAPKELRDREVIAFSYFFDRAAERGLIDPFKGGVITVQKFLQEAKDTCEIPNAEQPFACLDMTFIATFLHHGYGFNSESKIRLYKKIDNCEVSWALGLAFHILNNGI
ncbi:Ectonucleoside triphosphate diphosphohydrolase 5 [Armadillidium vulgare]|nr:Ectonucleoside triphosphate diphosphohydrolase 5 [Armadillidium vulgare]